MSRISWPNLNQNIQNSLNILNCKGFDNVTQFEHETNLYERDAWSQTDHIQQRNNKKQLRNSIWTNMNLINNK